MTKLQKLALTLALIFSLSACLLVENFGLIKATVYDYSESGIATVKCLNGEMYEFYSYERLQPYTRIKMLMKLNDEGLSDNEVIKVFKR